MVTLLIGADICPIGRNRPYFERGDAGELFGDLLGEFEAADLVAANLECPLIDRPSPIAKTGPTFGEAVACINGICAAGIDVLGLANNHILDHGAEGLESTMAVCAEAGIATVGAGRNRTEARRMLIRQCARLRVGILAAAEHEFSIATKDGWGANPLDTIDFVRNVREHKDAVDYLVVLVHGGDEFFVPSPRVKDTCRFMVEMGADAVIVQHPHVLGGYEEYQGGHIVYGQGALIMDEAIYREHPSFHEGFLVKLRVGEDARAALDIVPYEQSNATPGARQLAPDREKDFRGRLEERSMAVQDDARIEAEWLEFCAQRRHAYVSELLGHNRVLRKLNGNGLLGSLIHGKDALLRAKNTACCETHREAIETIFNHRMI